MSRKRASFGLGSEKLPLPITASGDRWTGKVEIRVHRELHRVMSCRRIWRRRRTRRLRPRGWSAVTDRRPGGATGARAIARIGFGASSCVVVGSVRLTTRTELDAKMTIPPDLQAQILRYHHVEKCGIM